MRDTVAAKTLHLDIVNKRIKQSGLKPTTLEAATKLGTRPIFKLEGGTDPVVVIVKMELGVNSIILGRGLSDSEIRVPTHYRGIET